MALTLERRKQLCVEYIKEARKLWVTPEPYAWQGPARYLSAAAALLPPYHKAELRPYACLIVAIRRRWAIETAAKHPVRLTIRQRKRLNLLTPTEARTYAEHCAWLRRNAEYRRQEARRLAELENA